MSETEAFVYAWPDGRDSSYVLGLLWFVCLYSLFVLMVTAS